VDKNEVDLLLTANKMISKNEKFPNNCSLTHLYNSHDFNRFKAQKFLVKNAINYGKFEN
jgi:hypothetical protein